MRLATIEQCREIDQLSEKVFSLNGEILMEAAGVMASREIEQAYYPELKRGTVAVVCGPGNNGADGLVVARHLHSAGHRDLVIFIWASEHQRSPLFSLQLHRVELSGIRLIDLHASPEQREQIRSSALIVDAIFGIGLGREVRSEAASLIDTINGARVPVVSLDVPSGLDADRGQVLGSAVRAHMTLTFGLAKPGFFVGEGPSTLGRLRVLPIGYPFEVLRGVCTSHFGFNEKLARRYLPDRAPTSHKAQHGHCLVLAGHSGYWGAGILCSSAAYRMGAGYVTWASEVDPLAALGEVPEVLACSFKDPQLWERKYSAVAIGPGLGVGRETAHLIEHLKKEKHQAVVLDADAISACLQFNLFPLPENWVVTPHTGELARVLGISYQEIERDRYNFALAGSRKIGCHVLLKGYRTILAYENRCMVIMSGNSALSKAGTGDVLTGMIAGLMAQGVSSLQSAATAAYIHGRMADEWVRSGLDRRTLLASDIRDQLPDLISRLADGALA